MVQSFTQQPSEKLSTAVDGNRKKNNWRMCKEWDTMEHSVPSEMYSPNPSPQSSGNYIEEEVGRL